MKRINSQPHPAIWLERCWVLLGWGAKGMDRAASTQTVRHVADRTTDLLAADGIVLMAGAAVFYLGG